MLVVSRYVGERVKVADNIWVAVVAIRGDKVRLGFDCPRSVKIMREELLEQERDDER